MILGYAESCEVYLCAWEGSEFGWTPASVAVSGKWPGPGPHAGVTGRGLGALP